MIVFDMIGKRIAEGARKRRQEQPEAVTIIASDDWFVSIGARQGRPFVDGGPAGWLGESDPRALA